MQPRLRSRSKFILVAAAALVAATSAFGVAGASTCVGGDPDPAEACAGGAAEGSADCTTGAPYYYGENGGTVQVHQGTTTHTVYANHFCYAFLAGPYSGSGTGITAGYYSYDSESEAYSGAGAFWTGFEYSNPGGSGSGCFTNVFTNNVLVVPDSNTPLGCPGGAPPGPPAILP